MSRTVVRIVVTQTEPDEHGYEQWRVTCTRRVRGRDQASTAVQDTKAAALPLVSNLLRDIAPGLTKADVLQVELHE